MKELISVIVPVYNTAKYLKNCLDSILRQTYKNIEIICVNDASNDKSGSILDDYADKYSNLRVVNLAERGGGVSNARNIALQSTKGELISFVDSDDYLNCDFLAVLYANLIENEAHISECGYKWVYDTNEESEAESCTGINILSFRKRLNDMLCGGSSVTCNALYRKEVLNDVKFRNYAIGEDAVFLTEVYAKNPKYKMVHTDKVLYYWFQRADSARTKGFNEKKLSSLKAGEKIVEIIKSEIPELERSAYLLKFKYYMGIASQIYAARLDYRYKQHLMDIKRELKNMYRRVDRRRLGKMYIGSYYAIMTFPRLYGVFAMMHYRKALGWK